MKKILIIEDEPSARKVMTDKFSREGLDVVCAFNGEDGLAKALEIKPDLILLDLIMPKMDGISMLRKLREDGEFGRKAQVMILTNITSDDEERMKELTFLGPECYLVKANWKLVDVVQKVKETLHVE